MSPRDVVRAAPLFVTRKNCLGIIGEEWPWVLRAARELGVPLVRRGKKLLVPAAAFVAALAATSEQHEPEPERVDPAEQVRRRLGVTRRST